VLFIHSFIHSGDLYSASSRHYYSEAQLVIVIVISPRFRKRPLCPGRCHPP